MFKDFFWSNYFKKKEILILLPLILIGLSLRIITAFSVPLWRDEIYAYFILKDNNFLNVLTQNKPWWDTCHPPLFFILSYPIAKIFTNQFILRIPSLIISLIILYLVPILAKKIDSREKYFPYLLLLLFSFSQTQISLNIVFKNYPLAVLFSLLSLIVFLDFLKKDNQRNTHLLIKSLVLGLINFLLFFTLYGGFYLLISYFIFFFFLLILNFFNLKKIKNLQYLFLSFLFSVALCNLIIIFYFQSGYPLCKEMIAKDGPIDIDRFLGFLYFFVNTTKYDTLSQLSINYLWLKTALLTLISFIGLFLIFKRDKLKGFFFIINVLTSFLVLYVLAYLTKVGIAKNRTLYILNIVFLVGLAYFSSFIAKNKNLIKKTLIIFLFLILIVDFFGRFPFLHYVDPPYDFLTLHKKIYSSSNEQDKIVFTHAPLYMLEHFRYYNLFYPIKNLQIFDLSQLKKDRENPLLKESEKTKVFYVDFLYEKNVGNQYMPENFSLIYDLNCPKNKRHFIDYIYLIECL